MDWFQLFINCIIFIGAAVVVTVCIWLVFSIPMMLVCFIASFFYNVIRFFIPFLPNIDEFFKKSPGSPIFSKNSYTGKTEIQKQYELNEHIRQQQINAYRNQR